MLVYKPISLFLGVCAVFQFSHCTMETYRYKSFPCSDSEVVDIVRSRVFEERQQRSVYHCAVACSRTKFNGGCRHAIYRKSNSTCQLIEKTEVVKSVPDYDIHEDDCTVIHSPFCHSSKFTCECPRRLTGRYCKLHNPHTCQKSEWRLATAQDYPILAASQIPLKMFIDSEIFSVTTFDTNHNTTEPNYVAQVNGFLAWNSAKQKHLEEPYQVLFILHNPLSNTTQLAKLNTNGDIDFTSSNVKVELYIPAVVDDTRLVYSDTVGNAGSVTLALSNGLQLLQRDFIQVEIEKETNAATFQTYEKRLKLNPISESMDWERPLVYQGFKELLKTDKRYNFDYSVNTRQSLGPFEEAVKPNWEVDRCWTKLHVSEDDEEFISVLKEYVERGQEVRMGIGGHKMSRVIEIRFTQTDVTSQLAPFIDMVMANNSFNTYMYSNIVHHVVSLSKQISVCQTELLRLNPNRLPTRAFTETKEWYISTRQWRKVYTINYKKVVLFGEERSVIEAARQGKTIRVCFSTPDTYYYYGRGSIKITEDNHLIFQTHQILQLDYSGTTFKQIYDADCKKVARVISTEGWIYKIILHPAATKNSFKAHEFVNCDWFIED